MRARILGWIALGLALAGLGASVASLVDYLSPVPTFCSDAGCATVRASAWAHPFGVPMPVFGVFYFAAMVVLAVVPRPRARLWIAVTGGAWALGLVGVMAFSIGAWCKLCLIADPVAIAHAIAVAAGAGTVRLTWRRAALAAPLLAACAGGLALWSHPAPPAVPAGTPELVAQAQVPGAVTIFEVVDFECPYCRAFAPRVADAIARAHAPVRVVRQMMPLSQHPHALAAAVAWCCADAQGKGDAMASALFAAPPDSLTRDGCEQLAANVGCDVDRYRRDVPVMTLRVADQARAARAAGIRSLPTVFVGGQRFEGAGASTDELVAAIDRAAR